MAPDSTCHTHYASTIVRIAYNDSLYIIQYVRNFCFNSLVDSYFFIDTRSKPMNIEKFRQHVKSLHEDKHKGFELEFYVS